VLNKKNLLKEKTIIKTRFFL